uniref:Rhodanese domain-containing protein n=1 Tax=Riptortus pedestris TaxID=329032 RepID=R4WDT7_RIPPE|nr:conserved hypothetical protein [Riptortus pedestris]
MSAASSVVNIDVNELQKFQKNPSATIIDVREPSELKETGELPCSTNIPLATVAAALQDDPSKFKEKYSIEKPLIDNPIVFSCRSGRRSLQAAESAASIGYKKVYNYAGGILDWLEHFPKGSKVECK